MIKKILIILSLFIISNISASTLTKTEHDIYYVWQGGGKPYMSEQYMTFEMDGITAYCIEPGVGVKSYVYKEMNELPFAKETLEKIKLYAYYGYTYKNHNTLKYRMATQALIWEEISKQTTNYYTKQYGYGEYININEEKNIINNLVKKHNIKPSFKTTKIKEFINTQVSLTDQNNVLNNYEVITNNAQIKNNELLIKVKQNEKIKLRRKQTLNKTSIFYEGKNIKTQGMAILTLDELDEIEIDVEVIEGTIELIKKPNKINKYTVDGAIYGIYDENNKIIKQLQINSGYSKTTLNQGKHYIKEIKAPIGYKIDKKIYKFEITKEKPNNKITLINEIIETKVIIHKTYGPQKQNESTVLFEIYQNNELINKIITNEEGIATINLIYGKYTFKQITTKKGYQKVDDFIVNIDGSKKEILYELVDEEIKSYIKLIKIDSETKQIINKKIKFKIKDIDNNKYICENEECTFETNNGYFITKNKYKGNLLIEEVKGNIDGYLWNDKKIKIFIGNNPLEEIFTVEYENKRIKGQIEVLKYNQNNQQLDNVLIGLFSNEDIYLNNKILYKKDELIKEKETKEGKVIFDNLEVGKYYIKELKQPENYILDTQKYEINIENEEIKQIKIKNYLKKGKLIFNKIDSLTKQGIENTLIEIYKDNKLIKTLKTNKKGQILLELEVGNYYIIEKEPAQGYKNQNKKLKFTIENEKETKLYMENDFIIEVPDTMKNNNIYIILLILIAKKYEEYI